MDANPVTPPWYNEECRRQIEEGRKAIERGEFVEGDVVAALIDAMIARQKARLR